MGQKQSGLTPKKIACLSKETHFSQNEIITWYQGTIYSKIKYFLAKILGREPTENLRFENIKKKVL